MSDLRLQDGSRVAVAGGGPAGSFFSYFLLQMAERAGLEVSLDLYEPKDYSRPGPASCNMCGGIVSESLVQLLATEGITLPPTVVQRGIDSYVLHMDVGSARIDPPGREKRIAAVHRGGGPRGSTTQKWASFDGHLLGLAAGRGASVVPERVESVVWREGRPRVVTRHGQSEPYDLVAVAAGVNGHGGKLLEALGYAGPGTTKTFICEFWLGNEAIRTSLGDSMHVFLLNLPRLEFGALIPKGDHVTTVLLGSQIDKQLVASFLEAPEVRGCFPEGWSPPPDYCRCFPSINVRGVGRPFADRMVFLGDCGENRLYKDGIGGAYRTAKAAAKAAVFAGVSAEAFRKHYRPVCRDLAVDNAVGKIVFAVTKLIQRMRFTRRGILRMVAGEQQAAGPRRLSGVLWDTFTGSAPYRDVFLRTLHPLFLARLGWEIAAGFFGVGPVRRSLEGKLAMGELGKLYHEGDVILRQGETGDCMYVVQSGNVEVIQERDGQEICLAELGEGDFFGEMALFEKDVRSATVRAIGEARVLTVDRKLLLRKIHEDPSLAFRIMQKMSRRVRELDQELMRAVADLTAERISRRLSA
jgi:flavin-dependent dehydrogenase